MLPNVLSCHIFRRPHEVTTKLTTTEAGLPFLALTALSDNPQIVDSHRRIAPCSPPSGSTFSRAQSPVSHVQVDGSWAAPSAWPHLRLLVGASEVGASGMSVRHPRVARCYHIGMTRTSQPTRLPADVYESAAAATLTTSRTVPQQIAHWARIGRELEMSPQVNHRAVTEVLTGTGSYDGLGEHEQAIVREEWADRATTLRSQQNYAAQFAAAGESYSEVDDDGNLIVHPAHR